MGRRNRRGRIVRDGATRPWKMDSSASVLAARDWDLDEWDPKGIAVSCILEALEGLWFDADDPKDEHEVNEHLQAMKQKIQEIL